MRAILAIPHRSRLARLIDATIILSISCLSLAVHATQARAQCPPPGIHPGLGDWGDAPEGQSAYPSLGVAGQFPTCFAPIPAPYIYHGAAGPNPPNLWWGVSVDDELDGNADFCPPPPYERDECWGPSDGDGGLVHPDPFTYDPGNMTIPCAGQAPRPLGGTCDVLDLKNGSSPLEANINSLFPGTGFVNVLFDWNQDGRWGGDVSGCGGGQIPEHAIQNLPVPPFYLGPLSGLNPGPIQVGPNSGHVWMRMTITHDQPQVPAPWDGSGCWDLGETEDYLIEIAGDFLEGEYGDAPEGALAYPNGNTGSFPTCRGLGPAGYIVHLTPGSLFFGSGVDLEGDGNSNQCPPAPYDEDECTNDGDAGLTMPRTYTLDGSGAVSVCPANQSTQDLASCQRARWGMDIDIGLTNSTSATAYVNVLADWNGDGAWTDAVTSCPGGFSPSERVLSDWPVPAGFTGLLSDLVSSSFRVSGASGYAWCRFTISEQPLGPNPWNGAGTFGDGETEDYLLLVNTGTSVAEAAGSSGQEITVSVTPNPTSRGTQIDLGLAKDARALVTIHDVTGRLVRTVTQQTLASGVHSLAWDGSDERGEAVPSGIYFVRGEADGLSAVQKLVVTR